MQHQIYSPGISGKLKWNRTKKRDIKIEGVKFSLQESYMALGIQMLNEVPT